jgi:hypothetical protein
MPRHCRQRLQGSDREPFPTAFVLTLRGDGVKGPDAVKYPHSDLAATGDEGQNLSLIGAALQADKGICSVVDTTNPLPARRPVCQRETSRSRWRLDVGTEAAKRIRTDSLTMAINQPFPELFRGRQPGQSGEAA